MCSTLGNFIVTTHKAHENKKNNNHMHNLLVALHIITESYAAPTRPTSLASCKVLLVKDLILKHSVDMMSL